MRVHPSDPRLYLVELSDFGRDPLPDPVRENLEPLRVILQWAHEYLCNPHPELGRSGPVCPFTRPSMRKETLFLTVCRGAGLDEAAITEIAAAYRDWFIELAPVGIKDFQYHTINIVFPDIPAEGWATLIEATQTGLKPTYVELGIMIGEFHPGPPRKTGLWNPDFRPLRSPLPLLSIRHMVPTDFAFLRERKEFMEAYLARHEDHIPAPMAPEVEVVAAEFGLR